MLSVDLNCDMGEGMSNDAELMKYISTANIACGGHAGDKTLIRKTIELALLNGVAVGAHPSFVDKLNFGRVDQLNNGLTHSQLETQLIDQLCLFKEVCSEFSIGVQHIKPHGALYNRAAYDPELAELICVVIKKTSIASIIYGLSGSKQEKICERNGLHFVHEVFADRTYQDDATLTPRSKPGSLITDTDSCVAQIINMINKGMVLSANNLPVYIVAETICVHGDGNQAVEFTNCIRTNLQYHKIEIVAPQKRNI